jgi:hypothetical protein
MNLKEFKKEIRKDVRIILFKEQTIEYIPLKDLEKHLSKLLNKKINLSEEDSETDEIKSKFKQLEMF